MTRYKHTGDGIALTPMGLHKLRSNHAFDVDVEKELRDGEKVIVGFTVERPDGTIDEYVLDED